MMIMADVLITGGAGNLGRSLARVLRKEGHSIRIFDLPSCDYSPFNGWEDTRIVQGNILSISDLEEAVKGVDFVFHLAALLPPASEVDRERTFLVNVDGTRNLIEACHRKKERPRIAFASSVSVFGDTSLEEPPIGPDHPVNPEDYYGESKVEAERIVSSSLLPYVNLRISGVGVAAFLDPPEPWPFTRGQRIELVFLDDLVRAMVNTISSPDVHNKTLIIAGGKTWQVRGEEYVRRWGEVMEIPFDEMSFQGSPGWFDWYDTSFSQIALGYQETSLDTFFKRLDEAVKEAYL